jgi:hypothetical protein
MRHQKNLLAQHALQRSVAGGDGVSPEFKNHIDDHFSRCALPLRPKHSDSSTNARHSQPHRRIESASTLVMNPPSPTSVISDGELLEDVPYARGVTNQPARTVTTTTTIIDATNGARARQEDWDPSSDDEKPLKKRVRMAVEDNDSGADSDDEPAATAEGIKAEYSKRP